MSLDSVEIIGADAIEAGALPLAVYNPLEALLSQYQSDLDGIEKIATFVADKAGLISHFIDGNSKRTNVGRFSAKELFSREGAAASLNSTYWSKALALTDVMEVLAAPKRNEWSAMIVENKTPAFERETVILTIKSLLHNRGQFFAEKVDAVFRSLSRDHVTNSPMGFSKRLIIGYMVDRFGYVEHRNCEYIQDLRCVVAKLLGREGPSSRSTYSDLSRVARDKLFGEWVNLDGCAIRVRLYKKGTAHLEIAPEVAWRLNQVLASLYPAAIPSEHRTKPSRKPKDHTLRIDLLPHDVLLALEDAVEESRYIKESRIVVKRGLSSSLKDRLGEVMSYIGGVTSPYHGEKTSWVFSYNPTEVLYEILRNGCLPEQASHQYFPTPEALAREAVDLAEIGENDTVLEPSAGQGGIADYLPKDQTTCVEISALHAAVLKAKGFNTIEADFLAWRPNQKYDRIAMNPPFSDGRAIDHLRHAAGMLADDGRLVAILPGSLVRKTLIDGWSHEWTAIREGGFEATKVHVAILVLTK